MSNVRSVRNRKREMEHEEKLKIIDQELLSFYQYCEQAGFTASEMEIICAPLASALRQNNLKKGVKIFVAFILAVLGVYCISQVKAFNMHMSAVGRLFMIKLLPVWDWTSMFYESCLVSNPFYGVYSLREEDCISCESLERIDRISDVTYQRLLDDYLGRDAPVIVVDAMTYWPVMNTDDFHFENITEIYMQDEKLIDTVPCVLTSNLRPGSSDLSAFLKRIQSPRADKWFVHWQNCDLNAVKALRRFYQRPYFLSSSVAPAHFNWVLMSSDYSTKMYKKVELDSGLIMVAQLRGSTSFRLTPHSPCNSSCPELLGDLQEGEMLVLSNYMWTFEYCPGRHLDNIAILTETVWEENTI